MRSTAENQLKSTLSYSNGAITQSEIFNHYVFSTPNIKSVVTILIHTPICNSSHNCHCRNPNHHTSVFFTCLLTTDKFPEIIKKDQRQHPKMQPLVCKPFIYGISATFLFSSCHQHDSLNMHAAGELVHGLHLLKAVVLLAQKPKVTGERGRITGYVHDSARVHTKHRL